MVTLFAASLLMGGTGCDELSARRKIQKAGKLYQRGKFDEACALYDEVVDLIKSGEVADIAHYNGGICYHKMFRPGRDTDENHMIANKATEHFGAYLEVHPEDRIVVSLMSQIWMDSGDYESALRYWEKELAKNPKDAEVILILAGIHRQMGNWEKAIEYHYKEAAVHDDPHGKAGAIMNVAKLTSNKLFNRNNIYWEERIRIADIGISALEKAAKLTPEDPDLWLYMGTMYNLRAEAHQASWAQVIDKSNGRYYHRRSGVLRKKKAAAEAKAAGLPPPGEAPAGDGDDEDDGPGAEHKSGAGAENQPQAARPAAASPSLGASP